MNQHAYNTTHASKQKSVLGNNIIIWSSEMGPPTKNNENLYICSMNIPDSG